MGAELEVSEDFGRRLLASQSEVQQGCLALESHRDTLSHFCDELNARTVDTKERALKAADASTALQSGKRICQTANTVEEQLLKVKSEDSAIEDASYYLQKGLEAGNVNLESCLKVMFFFDFIWKTTDNDIEQSLRLLASEQFQKKALVAKISAILAASQ